VLLLEALLHRERRIRFGASLPRMGLLRRVRADVFVLSRFAAYAP